MAEAKRIEGPTEVGKGEYKPQSTMTPEQQAEAAKKHKASKKRAMGQRSKRYQPPQNVEPERVGGGLTEAEMNVKAPGPPTVVRQEARPKKDVRIQRVTPKKYAAPKAALGRQGPGEMQRKAKVDVKTGRPTKTYGERAISYLEGLGTKIAPPGSVTRLRETGARAPRTMSERLGSIGRTASRTFPGKASKSGGILDIPELAARGKGPALKAQKGTKAAAKRRAALSLAEKQRKGMRVTGADVPSAVPRAQREVSTSVGEIKRTEGATEGHLGKFVGRGAKPPPPIKVAKAPVKRKATAKPKPKKKWWERALEVTRELSAEATRDAAKYEERKAGEKKDVKKVQRGLEKLPPKPPKRRR